MKDIVLQMRENKHTYKEIRETTKLAYGTISWIVSKYFPEQKQKDITSANNKIARRNDVESGRINNALEAHKERWDRLRNEAREQYTATLLAYPDRSFIHFIAGLYQGEGSHKPTHFSLANSNPRLVRAFVFFIRRVLNKDDTQFCARLAIHVSMDREKCEAFWCETLGISLQSVTQVDNREQKKVHRHKENYYGTININVYKPMGLAAALEPFAFLDY